MNATDLCFTSAFDLATLIRTRQVSPVEVIDAFADRIARLNPIYTVFSCRLPEMNY